MLEFDLYLDALTKIGVVLLLTGPIAIERELRHKGAGLRTHILVSIGSMGLTLTSFYLSDIYKDVTYVDPSRMVSGLIAGIGFLCGGTILRGDNNVYGLTTAATLWIASCIGIAVGAGFYPGAAMVALTSFVILTGTRPIERKINEYISKEGHDGTTRQKNTAS